MKKERKVIAIDRIQLNEGQLDWLPKNPRQWTQADIERTAASIVEDPDFLEDRPLLVVPFGEDFVSFGGNLRHEGCAFAKKPTAPCVIYYPETEEDYTTIKRRAMKDNGSFGSWDFDELANSWDDLPLADWGIPAWSTEDALEKGLSSKGKEGAEGYDEFLDKFEQKLTTDDCYTPAPVYDAVREWVIRELGPFDKKDIVRPFYPGGDYKRMDQYPEGCVVLDNPPFSIYAEIVRFYLEHGIAFFLFGPHLTLKVRRADVTYVVTGQAVTYENGAVVNTSFVTNLPKLKDYRIFLSTSLYRAIGEADKASSEKADLSRYKRPPELWTIPVLSKIAKGEVDFGIRKDECAEVQNIECLKEMGKSLFGGGVLVEQRSGERSSGERSSGERSSGERSSGERSKTPIPLRKRKSHSGETGRKTITH